MITATLCHCGAVEIYNNEQDKTINMPEAMFYAMFSSSEELVPTTYCCNYCVNGWGVDLCGCGSKQKVGKCDGDFTECENHRPAQHLDDRMIAELQYFLTRKHIA